MKLKNLFPKVSSISEAQYTNTQAQQGMQSLFEGLAASTAKYPISLLNADRTLDALNKEEATNLISYLVSNYKISGALHLSSLETILVEEKNRIFWLKYGSETALKKVNTLQFNIEDGFYLSWSENYNFIADLNNIFSAWRRNNYQGKLFPETFSIYSNADQDIESSDEMDYVQNKDEKSEDNALKVLTYMCSATPDELQNADEDLDYDEKEGVSVSFNRDGSGESNDILEMQPVKKLLLLKEIKTFLFIRDDQFYYVNNYKKNSRAVPLNNVQFNAENGWFFPASDAIELNLLGELQKHYFESKEDILAKLFPKQSSVITNDNLTALTHTVFFSPVSSHQDPISAEKSPFVLANDMIAAANRFVTPSDKVNAIKDIIFRKRWSKNVVSKVASGHNVVSCFVSYNYYKGSRDASVLKVVADLEVLKKPVIETIISNDTLTVFQRATIAIKSITDANMVLCFRSEDDAKENLFNFENPYIDRYSNKVIPISIGINSDKCFDFIRQKKDSLAFNPSQNGLVYSTFFSNLLLQAGILDNAGKAAFDDVSKKLREEIEMEFDDKEILAAIDKYEKELQDSSAELFGLNFK